MIPKFMSAPVSVERGYRLRRSMLFGMVALVLGLVNAPPMRAQMPQMTFGLAPSFEVATIKPNRSGDNREMMMFRPGRFTATGSTVKQLITEAYKVKGFQISGGPGWISSEKYNIEAKVPDALMEELQKLPSDQRLDKFELMIQSLLADRFKLKVTQEPRELPIYALVVAKTGAKLQEAKPGDTYPNGMKGPDGRPVGWGGMMRMGRGQLGLLPASVITTPP
jgi:uncharacterized protein (TIGR03435 family)